MCFVLQCFFRQMLFKTLEQKLYFVTENNFIRESRIDISWLKANVFTSFQMLITFMVGDLALITSSMSLHHSVNESAFAPAANNSLQMCTCFVRMQFTISCQKKIVLS
ncbi:hypothetical protein CEXT_400601 [Caerostris extrusa]|uniref:Uncharacterized protein n=1 Tax=Caerostris extrusa TaxID=172846 RepID=A0AAV4RBP1_CAEEX|nr:hypothetical protein CEXT_400601 [Caerostris extrusa]